MDLQALLRQAERRDRRMKLGYSASAAVSLVLASLLVMLWLDITWHLPPWGRVLACSTIVLLVVGGAAVLVRRWRVERAGEDALALAIERRTPGDLENRLINTLQLSRAAADTDDAAAVAVIRENRMHLAGVPLESSAAAWPAGVSLSTAVALLIAGAIFWASSPEHFRNAAARIFLPLAQIDPLYATVLEVTPGNVSVRPGTVVTVGVRISGRMPSRLAIVTEQAGRKTSEQIALPATGSTALSQTASFALEPAHASMSYIVTGGDYTSPRYTIEVPTPLDVDEIHAAFRYPAYTQLADQQQRLSGGDADALAGTRGALEFVLSLPANRARMILASRNAPPEASKRTRSNESASSDAVKKAGLKKAQLKNIELTKTGARTFSADWVFAHDQTYWIEAEHEGRTVRSPPHVLRSTPDAEPRLELSGIESTSEISIDSLLPLSVSADDDIGLARVGLFWRRQTAPGKSSATPAAAGKPATTKPPTSENAWKELRPWKLKAPLRQFRATASISFAAMDVLESDVVELAARGQDADPAKRGRWSSGEPVVVRITSPNAALHVLYRRILDDESQLASLTSHQQELIRTVTSWIKKFDLRSGVRWDDQQTLGELARAMHEQARAQGKLRIAGNRLATNMVADAGRLRVSVGMLADTEMVRSIAILEAVPKRENPQDKKAALSDARLTQERIARSLSEIHAAYIAFRQDWEMTHMLSYTKQLAERQTALAKVTERYASTASDPLVAGQRATLARRQSQLGELAELGQRAYQGIADRESTVGPILASAYREAATSVDSLAVKTNMRASSAGLAGGDWTAALTAQRQAAASLDVIYNNLRKAQTEAARKALDDVKELAKQNPAAEREIEKLKRGTGENLIDFKPEELNLADAVEMRRVAEQLRDKRLGRPPDKTFDYLFEEHMKSLLTPALVKGKGQDFNTLSLAKTPSSQMSFPKSSDRLANRVKAAVQEEFKDLVGDLLEEADDLRDKYETYNINAAFQTNEPGDVGKQGGDLNSTAASAATGNMKQPTHNFGGALRSGRQGARAHGLVVGDRSVNRRGRDTAQQGQEDVARQGGQLKQTMSGDPQKDASTGRGGKRVDSEETAFSTKDAGEWKDEDAAEMGAPQQKFQVVERKGRPLDPRVAEMMRDLTSKQEQVLARIQAVKKQLDQLYLPSDHLDDLMAQLGTGLDRLRQQPDAEVFRKQIELLDKLTSTVVVFDRPSAEYLRGAKRNQALRGKILDAPPASVLPGYEQAVEEYYKRLSGIELLE